MTYVVQEIKSPNQSLSAVISGSFSIGPNFTLLVSPTDPNSVTIDLAPLSSITPGVYNQVWIDVNGRVTSADTVNYLTSNQTIVLSGDVTGSGTTSIVVTLPATGVPEGTYTKVTVDTKGRVISASNLTFADIIALLGYTPADKALLGAANGIATLDSNATLVIDQLPPIIDLGNF
jgi:hypothetical protein